MTAQRIDDLDLVHLPIETPEFAADPTPWLEKARARHPWLATSSIGPVLTSYRAIDEIMRMDDALKMPGGEIVAIMGAEGTGWGDFAQEMMLVREGQDHQRLRGSVSGAFGPNNVKRMRPVMIETISALLDEWAPKGAFDFAEFAANFPVRVMFALIGGDVSKLPAIISSLEVQGTSFNMIVEDMPKIEEAYQVLWRFVDDLIGERGPDAGKGDLLDDLIAANTRGELTDKELRQMLVFLFGAGYDTSKNLLTLLMNTMIDHPDIWRHCAQDKEYCRLVVREQLRLTSPSNTYRVTTRDVTWEGVTIPAGTMLLFPLGISGRDPTLFADPLRFMPERPDRTAPLAFGRGMHICLGQFLAQANVEEATHLIARRLKNPRHTVPAQWRSFAGVWGIKSLPIAFDPTPTHAPEPA
ncbi:cytochrome P450 [Novosphingobium mangrovi (ex Huang et al. 2023)]|uniref:Cytochrome P450 n=1 Tax=Novosphingobium mangrovi (ex Huang et al. 2023) TaxID=2976432 RepID=A0ABT2I5W8_9SPHN|nr:cytochrome P450 [Novosphingobium mangrovi (ex Huang et al. 2023)]MCT2400204.1 cytochrome P450 [Novosphingobium mangrovi (ex Huang et al. 2023)]